MLVSMQTLASARPIRIATSCAVAIVIMGNPMLAGRSCVGPVGCGSIGRRFWSYKLLGRLAEPFPHSRTSRRRSCETLAERISSFADRSTVAGHVKPHASVFRVEAVFVDKVGPLLGDANHSALGSMPLYNSPNNQVNLPCCHTPLSYDNRVARLRRCDDFRQKILDCVPQPKRHVSASKPFAINC